MNMIVVDDEVTIRKGIIKLFELADIHMTSMKEAANGREALDIMQSYKPDLILTDIRMPVMDGLEFIDRVREIDEAVEIIVLSGYAEFEYVQRALRNRVSDYLLKPVTQENFNEAVLKVMLKDPAKWTLQLSMENIEMMKDSIMELVRCVMSGDRAGIHEVLDHWFRHCANHSMTIIEIKQVMGHFQLLFRAELHSNLKEYPSFKQSAIVQNSSSLEVMQDRWKQYATQLLEWIQAKKAPRNQKIIEEVVRYIEHHYGDVDLNLRSISSKMEMSPAYLSKIFREVMNKPITQYISEYRLEMARQRLMTDEAKINAIAEACGFHDYPYFSKIFKKRYGLSPQDYKEINT